MDRCQQGRLAQRQHWASRYVYPVFGDVPVADVNTELVLKVLKPIWYTKTETASRVRAHRRPAKCSRSLTPPIRCVIGRFVRRSGASRSAFSKANSPPDRDSLQMHFRKCDVSGA